MGVNLKPVSGSDVYQSAFPDKFKPKKDEAYRLWLPEIENLYRAKTHFLKPNYTFCLAAPENGINQPCPCCAAGDYARWRYGMNVVVYKTDMTAKLRPVVRDGKESVDWEVKLWLFSQTAANELYIVSSMFDGDKEWALKHDVKLTAIDPRRGKYSIQHYPDSVFTVKPELQDLIINSLKAGRRDPVKELGALLSAQEMEQGIARGGLKKDDDNQAPQIGRPAFGGGQIGGQARYPASQELRDASLNSPAALAPAAGHNPADKKLADETIAGNASQTREISNDKEFEELLEKIKAQRKVQ